jgi:hypothetical protein
MAMVGFPDGTRIRASSISDRCVDDPKPTFGLYLDARWDPTWPVQWFAEWAQANPHPPHASHSRR